MGHPLVAGRCSFGTTAKATPTLSFELVFDDIKITVDDAPRAASIELRKISSLTETTWTVVSNPTASPRFEFRMGGGAAADIEARQSFAPPEQAETATRVARFESSVELETVDQAFVQDLAWAAAGKSFKSGTVEVYQASRLGKAALSTTYGFTKPFLESITVSGLSPTLTFSSDQYTITEGKVKTTIP